MATTTSEANSKEPIEMVFHKRINDMNEAVFNSIEPLRNERNKKRNELYAKRTEVLKGKAPKTFWATVFRAHKDISEELLGSYDNEILDSLESLDVQFLESGDGDVKITMKFGKNNFFSDSELCIECVDDEFECSNVHWKEGKGPLDDDEDEQDDGKVGEKRQRGQSDDRGDSFFQLFEDMGPHPEEDEECDDMDADEFDDLIEEYEEELDEKKKVFECIVMEVWADPAGALSQAA